jgi:2-oxo-4-hydroxy-4-carboxy-5-ureidoimidazoline decarboxylase
MNLDQFNALTYDEALKDLQRCCGSRRWANQMAARRPFRAMSEIFAAADQVWKGCDRADVLEAFRHHPKIGEVAAQRSRHATTQQWADGEQAGIRAAAESVLQKLAAGNEAYEQQFGFIFIVCATGKTSDEMLATLEERLRNQPAQEWVIAAGEQAKITRIRLGKLLQEETRA